MDSNTSDSTIKSGFLAELSSQTRLSDFLLIVTIPMIMAAVSVLPMSTRRSLAFNPDAPTLLSAFAAHYIHFEAAHLVGNLLLYILIVPMVYLLFTLSNCRKELAVSYFTILLVFPFLLSGLNLFLPRSGVIISGFSGLGMAFVGLLPVGLFRFLEERLPRTIELKNALSLFFAGAALIAFRMAPSVIGLAIGSIAILIALLFTWRLLSEVGSITRGEVGRALDHTGYVELAVTAAILFFVATFMAFPSDPFLFGGVIDLTTHLLGDLLGFTLGFVIVGSTKYRQKDEVPEPPDSFDDWDFQDSSE
ncbi:MAG: hypothetical protein ABEH59_02505 [Halobacteriales archaeon]